MLAIAASFSDSAVFSASALAAAAACAADRLAAPRASSVARFTPSTPSLVASRRALSASELAWSEGEGAGAGAGAGAGEGKGAGKGKSKGAGKGEDEGEGKGRVRVRVGGLSLRGGALSASEVAFTPNLEIACTRSTSKRSSIAIHRNQLLACSRFSSATSFSAAATRSRRSAVTASSLLVAVLPSSAVLGAISSQPQKAQEGAVGGSRP